MHSTRRATPTIARLADPVFRFSFINTVLHRWYVLTNRQAVSTIAQRSNRDRMRTAIQDLDGIVFREVPAR